MIMKEKASNETRKNILIIIYMMYTMTYRQISMNGGAIMDNKKTATVFKAFCGENRLKILQLLQLGEKCACRLLEAMEIT